MSATRPSQAGPAVLLHGERRWILRDGVSIIGRGDDAAVRIESGGVSRHHARITVSAGRATIEDLGSKNGTFAGEPRALDRVTAPRPLRDGDIIRLGRGVRLLFRDHDDEPTETEASSAYHAGATDAGAPPVSPRAARERPSSLGEQSRSGAAASVPARESNEFRREGELWTLRFGGRVARLADAKGLQDLARLLARPGVEVHCLELADRPLEPAAADRVLDARARREIEARARELRQEIEAADQAHDLGRAEQAREELDRLTEELAGALGLHGRSRDLGGAAERARSSVTWRIRSAIKRIAAVHPRLARHLQNAVRTGTFCGYHPETPIDWRL